MSPRLRRPLLLAVTKPHLGLGNRMRSVLGARVLARREGRHFAYTWPTGRSFGADLDDLWEFPEHRIGTARARRLALTTPYRDGDLAWLDEGARAQPMWLVRTGHALALPPGAGSWEEELRSLAVAPELADRVRRVFGEQLSGAPYIGVMIRAHTVSHAQTRELSPVTWYLERMRHLRRRYPQRRFYVSCDVPAVQAEVMSRISGCVALSHKGDYNSGKALRAAVTDLYLLACSSHLIGPHYSSFPELAQILAGGSVALETSQTGGDPDLDQVAWRVVSDPCHPSS